MNKTLHTKFGIAKINNKGYYKITTRKEDNHGKYLHRLIWEDFYGCEVPKGYVIHHRNHIKTDNCILNLQLMSKIDHTKLHHTGENHHLWNKHPSEETRQKMSDSHSRDDLNDDILAKEYFDNGLSGCEIGKKYNCDPTTVYARLKKNNHKIRNQNEAQNTSGYYRVCKVNSKKYKQGFCWRYSYYKDGKKKIITSVDIKKLEEKVRAKNLEWRQL